ncbi:uroporphyrinogen decarboxylase family protein, partial [Staphylococcus aureus]|uniref:uroporphyrinogen decarboxylase family protein n=1 Tax=Staphylococcus aureus TaxID=1280 RepID=UPI0028CB823D
PLILFRLPPTHLINQSNHLPIHLLPLHSTTSINHPQQLPLTKTLQPNLHPSILLPPSNLIQHTFKPILHQPMHNPKHIFNLPHALFPEVQPHTLPKVSQFLHTYTQT